mgnify:CR=1 FL=1
MLCAVLVSYLLNLSPCCKVVALAVCAFAWCVHAVDVGVVVEDTDVRTEVEAAGLRLERILQRDVEAIERVGSALVMKHQPDILKTDDPWFRDRKSVV